MISCIVFLYIISCLGRGRLRLHMVFIVKLHRKIAWWKWIIVSVGYSVLGVLNLLPDFIMKSAVKRFQFVSQGFIGEGRLFSYADVPCCIYSDSAFGAQSGCYLVVAYAPWQFKAEYKIQFTSIPTWFSIGQSVANWWKLHATHVNDFPAFNLVAHALLLIATTSSSTTTAMLVINCVPKMTYGGEKPSSSSAFSFRQSVREWEPDNWKSNWAKGREGVIAVLGSRAIMFDKMGPSNPAEHFSQRSPKYAVWGHAGWEKTQIYRWEDCFSCCLHQVTVNKLTVDLLGN